MTRPTVLPCDTRLNVLYGLLEVVEVRKLVDGTTHPWCNQTLFRVNDAVVRPGPTGTPAREMVAATLKVSDDLR